MHALKDRRIIHLPSHRKVTRAPEPGVQRGAPLKAELETSPPTAGTILFSASGDMLWADPTARQMFSQCPGDWLDLISEDARFLTRGRADHVAVERLFGETERGAVRARSVLGPQEAGVDVVTTLELLQPRRGDQGVALRRLGLSERQIEVARLAAEGLGSRQIGYRLGIATPTVCTHLAHIYRKTGTSGRVELARLLFSGGPETSGARRIETSAANA